MESIKKFEIKNQKEDRMLSKIVQIRKPNHVLNNTLVLFFTQNIFLDQKA